MITRRAMLGGTIIAAWVAGLAVLVQREYFRPQVERLAEAAIRVTPAVVYFVVTKDGRQVGFASSTVDTARASITISDYFVANAEHVGKRTAAWTDVTFTRGMRVRNFDTELDGEGPPKLSAGRFIGDTALIYGTGTTNEKVDSQRVSVSGPVLLPNMIPLAIALVDPPKVGKSHLVPVLDPVTMATKTASVRVLAESLFTVPDSAVFDSASARWRTAHSDTIRAWRFTAEPAGTFDAWVDEQGRVVETTQLGFMLQRMTYELAFRNWKADSSNAEPTRPIAAFRAAISQTQAIYEPAQNGTKTALPSLLLALSGMDVSTLSLETPRQHLSHDTLFVGMDDLHTIAAAPLPRRNDVAPTMRDHEFQSANPVIRSIADSATAGTRDPVEITRRLAQFVHASVGRSARENSTALDALAARQGDAPGHVLLFIALARAAGLTARPATGLHYAEGSFYFHAWSEVLLGNRWVAVDPTFNQFPADAAHVTLLAGRLVRKADLLNQLTSLRITVLAVGTPVPVPMPRASSK